MSEQGKLSELDSILLDYSLPYSQGKSFVDSGNLYYAATEYRSAYQELQQQCEKLVEALNRIDKKIRFDVGEKFMSRTHAMLNLEHAKGIAQESLAQYEEFKKGVE